MCGIFTYTLTRMSSVVKTKIFKQLDETIHMLNGKKHREDGPAVYSPLVKEWWVNGQLHRVDGPARMMSGGSMMFYEHGKLHRKEGPAVILSNGCQEWWVNGIRHRKDGPAYIYGVCQEWWENGRLHRVDGPALTNRDRQEWYENGNLHSLDGPAVVYNFINRRDWYIDGRRYENEEEHKQAILDLRLEISNTLYNGRKVCRDVAKYISCFVY